MVTRGVREFCDRFDRAQVLGTTPGQNGWTVKDTSSEGIPTYLVTAAGMKLTLASTSEAEIVTMAQNDVLVYPLAKLRLFEFIASVAAVDAVTTIVMGLASAQADDVDDLATALLFKIDGTVSLSAVVAESDDGAIDLNDKPTGVSLGSVPKRFTFDFEEGLSDVKLYIDGERVAANVKFDLSHAAASQGVQPFFQIQKTSGTGVPALTIREVRATYNYATGV